jgi:branched-subunit amino acid transport protein
MALVTLLVRALPLLTMRGELPAGLGRWLGYVPVAVFTSLALRPIAVSAGPAPQLVAWRTGNTLATIMAGMAAYWALRMLNVEL